MIFEKTTDKPEVNDKIYPHNTAPATHCRSMQLNYQLLGKKMHNYQKAVVVFELFGQI